MAGKATNRLPDWLRIVDGDVVLSTKKTAEFFGVTRATLSNWAKQGAPKMSRGWWNPRELMEWLGKMSPDDDGDMSLEARKLKADAEYREEKAKREKRMNEILEGQYVSAEEVENEWARRVVEVKTGLLSMTNVVVGQFSDPEMRLVVERVLRNEIQDLLEQYARDGTYTPKRKGKKR